jgi:arabinan endo-1,5-alpha-L-arabinosidase
MRRAVVLALLIVSPGLALDGQPGMHDPSTVVVHDGKFYVYATGNGLPIAISDDGWTWRRAGTLMQALPAASRARTCSRAAATTRGRPT